MSKPKLEYVGISRSPVIVIDDYVSDTQPLIQHAMDQAAFSRDEKSFYPGMRSELPRDYVVDCLKPMIPHLYSIYNIPKDLKARPVDLRYSLITQAPHELQAIQTLPHFDTPSRYTIAILHYLNDQPHGGTGFFRHKATGYEYINEQRQAAYFSHVQKIVDDFTPEAAAYCPAQSEHFECYHEIEFRHNRIAAYPGSLLHTAMVNPKTDVDANPQTGRLTANMLIEFV
ncbi:DUF6445 family protein [Marinimicrobium sp. ABcell2]|uniref:DUF6445 family protein n=1 Tax=Marinimicrobium sp. ABcell2 TaxID=3069751 RepID=UPI0027B5B8D6|nr:DUF6445 family protein [Marinimicrobium sp. ABcell2]MDQ2075140.1 DUF6445 family protein [Marinimicrobium sp. ABcell2]